MSDKQREWCMIGVYVCEGECGVCHLGDEPLIMTRCKVVGCHSYMKPLKAESPSVAKLTTDLLLLI